MITLEKFNREYIPKIESWLDLRDLPIWSRRFYPAMGYVACMMNVPLAAGFIRFCEPDIAIFDSFITDPTFASHERHLALEAIIDKLFQEAKDNGYITCMAFTEEATIINRAKAHGFKIIAQTILSINLGDRNG